MPAPDIKVLNYILNLYIVYDKQKEESDTETQPPSRFSLKTFMVYAETAKDFITGNDKITQELNKICDRVKWVINIPEKGPDDWIKLIFELGEKAAIAQAIKPSAGQSRCCEILHALRNEIVKSMTKEDDEYKKAFFDKVAELKEKIKNYDDEGDKLLPKLGVGVAELDEQVLIAYRQLAYLEDPASIRRARRYGLLNHLLMTDEREAQYKKERISGTSDYHYKKNVVFPYLLQPDTCETLYVDKYQKQTNYSFQDFRIKGIPTKDKKLPDAAKKAPGKENAVSANQAAIENPKGGTKLGLFSQEPGPGTSSAENEGSIATKKHR